MTYGDICKRLRACGIENFDGEARILIEELCGDFSIDRDYNLQALADAVKKRCEHYPLQYIIGKWWFCRCEFEVDENCLIPRPDTELVVETAEKLLGKNASFADLCTGSGCIAISLLNLRPDLCGLAVDLYPKTLEIAKKNAERNSVGDRLSFKLGDVLSHGLLGNRVFEAVISNPPYIRSGVVPTLSREVGYEPQAALDGGDDGLVFYKGIIDNFAKNLSPDGLFIFEIGYDQADDIRAIASERGFGCEIKKDLGGNDRVAVIYH